MELRILDAIGVLLLAFVVVAILLVIYLRLQPAKPVYLPLPSGVRIEVTRVPDEMRIPGERQYFDYSRLVDRDGSEFVGPNILKLCFDGETVEGYAYDWVWPRGEGWGRERYFFHRRGNAATIIDISSGPVRRWKKAIADVTGKPCGADRRCMLDVADWPSADRLAFTRAEKLRTCGREPESVGKFDR